MLALLQYNLPLLGLALLIGVATGRWIVRARAAASENIRNEDK